jgi:homopolymeric O-antigen transport system permease protein
VFRRLWSHHALATSLIRRQYQLRYRQSAVGVLWAILPPIAGLLVATVVFHGVIGVPSGRPDVPYALFTFAALTPWTFFASGVTSGVPSIVASIQMVTRLPFPRAVIPIGTVGTSLIDLGISFIGFVVYAIVTGAGVPITALWMPMIVLIEIVLVMGLVFLGSALNVFARDIRLAVPLVMQLWLFLTPVMYPLESVPESLRPLYLLNPMTGIVEVSRQVLAYGETPSMELLLPAVIGAGVCFVIGSWYFSATEERFADAI